MYKVLLKIDGMSCSMCEAHMNDTIRSRYSVGYRLISCSVEKEGNEEKPRASLFGFLKR